jgi:hypothetical protein
LAEALEADPDSDEVERALLWLAPIAGRWVEEALMRVVRSREPSTDSRHALLLVRLATEGHVSPSVGLWAITRLEQAGPLHGDLVQHKAAFELGRRKSGLWQGGQWSRSSLAELRLVVQGLAEQPEQGGAYAEALLESFRREPERETVLHDLERALWRLGRFDELERLWQSVVDREEPLAGAVLGLLRLYFRHGATDKALSLVEQRPERFHPLDAAALSALASIAGRPEQRAAGLALMAEHSPDAVRAVLYSVSSSLNYDNGRKDVAFRLAELACHANPRSARAVVCCAEAAREQHARVAALAFERACEMVVPRARYCRELVFLAERAKDVDKARRWAQRWLSLTPLDTEAGRILLEQWERSTDAKLLAKGLDWWLGQPRPRGILAAEFGRGVQRLVALDPARARLLAQRVLGAYGVLEPSLYRALLDVARTLEEPALEVAIFERALVADPEQDPVALLLKIADRHSNSGDGDAACDALERALEYGAPSEEIAVRLQRVPVLRTSDGEIARLRCRAECSARAGDKTAAADAFRHLGAAYWDLAGDRVQAIAAWERAADLEPGIGDDNLAQDVVAFCGYTDMVPTLRALAGKRPPGRAAGLLLAGAGVALRDGYNLEAATLAEAVIEISPEQTEALAVLEKAVPEHETETLERAYAAVASAALGVFGLRALHYRAARQLERRRQHALALEHAVHAFEAVPAQGVAYALMLRLASTVGDESKPTRAIGRVAENAATPKERTHWLEVAARTAGPGVDGVRLRVEVLLRSITLQPTADQIERLGAALGTILEEDPGSHEHWDREFDNASRALLRSLDDPEDVATALATARVAAERFGNAMVTASAIERAIQLAANAAEFATLGESKDALLGKAAAARRVVDAVIGALNQGRECAQSLLTLAVELAEQHSASCVRQLEVARALSEPINPAWVERAQKLAVGDPTLLARLGQALPRAERVRRLWLRIAELQEAEPARAIDVLEQHRDVAWLDASEREELLERLAELYRRTERFEELEALLMRWVDSGKGSESLRRTRALELCRLLARRSLHAAALDVLSLVGQWGPLGHEEIELGVEIARTSGDRERELSFLEAQQSRAVTSDAQRELLVRLWQLHDELGHAGAAAAAAERLLELDPNYSEARSYLLLEAERQQDYPQLVRWLEDRISKEGGSVELYLQLSEVLARAMAEPERAALVLDSALAQFPESVALLQRAAEVEHTRDEFERSAALLERAARVVTDPVQQALLVEHAARTLIEGRNPAAARVLLAANSGSPAASGLLRLDIDLARAEGDDEQLALALERLAANEGCKADERARALCESAELALQASAPNLARERAQRAAALAPRSASAQLLARRLEYLDRGAGTSADALATITALRGLGDLAEPELAALKSFLLAEALDRRVGLGAGERELASCANRHGRHALIALGQALRLAEAGQADEALTAFEQALAEPERVAWVRPLTDVGEEVRKLIGTLEQPELRARWQSRLESLLSQWVAPLSARVSSIVQEPALAKTWGSATAAEDHEEEHATRPASTPGTQSEAEVPPESSAPREVSGGTPVPRADQYADEQVADEANEPILPLITIVSQPPLVQIDTRPVTRESGASKFDVSEARAVANETASPVHAGRAEQTLPPDASAAAQPSELTSADAATEAEVAQRRPPPKPGRAAELPMARPRARMSTDPGLGSATPESFPSTPAVAESGPVAAARAPENPAPRLQQPLSLESVVGNEEELMAGLRAGSVVAGERLLMTLLGPERAHDRVNVCRQIVALKPGDATVLTRLLHAVVADNDAVYAAALRHALLVFSDAGRAPAAPPLAQQAMQPDAVLSLLCGPSEPALEVLSALWQAVPHLFRDPGEPPPDSSRLGAESLTPLGQLNTTLCRLMGISRVHVYHRQGPRPVQLRLVLDQPIRLIVTGPDLADAPEFRFHFASMLLASRPEYALLYGLSEGDVRDLLDAVLAAFGPPGRVRRPAPEVLAYAERLWETVPPRVQRRLRELTVKPEVIDYQTAFAATNTALWRAGLFASGELGVSVAQVCAQEQIDVSAIRNPSGLRALCEANPRLAAVIRFATSVEYAEARWRPLRSMSSSNQRSAKP